tara:strand:+ start:2025 stop:2999 length:975 start_codon:yes stop_codon:yes gene_type:complete
MTSYSQSVSRIIDFSYQILSDFAINKNPKNLYSPINYMLSNQGKHIRPILSLLSNYMFGGNMHDMKEIVLSIEKLHNFTLIHDDVMDNAQLRRGVPTINIKWSDNQAILSGDVLLIKSYQQLLKSKIINKQILNEFTETSIKICEGQQLDLDFQFESNIKLEDYLNMIDLKTGALIQFCLVVPCILLDVSKKDIQVMEEVGSYLGKLFQIQDDYLDLYGDESDFGKKIGGDIIEKKKTFLYVSALNKSNIEVQCELQKIYNSDNSDKLDNIISIYHDLNIKEDVQVTINNMYEKILKLLSTVQFQDDRQKFFIEFLNRVLNRNY